MQRVNEDLRMNEMVNLEMKKMMMMMFAFLFNGVYDCESWEEDEKVC